jgi:hypothetical protein
VRTAADLSPYRRRHPRRQQVARHRRTHDVDSQDRCRRHPAAIIRHAHERNSLIGFVRDPHRHMCVPHVGAAECEQLEAKRFDLGQHALGRPSRLTDVDKRL